MLIVVVIFLGLAYKLGQEVWDSNNKDVKYIWEPINTDHGHAMRLRVYGGWIFYYSGAICFVGPSNNPYGWDLNNEDWKK